MKRLAGSLIGLVLWIVVAPNLLAQSIDRELAGMVEQFAPDFYNSAWKISLAQYKAWIVLITLQEAGDNRYHAHSTGTRGSDVFFHQDPKADGNFPFSTGVGPFQLDRCKGSDCVDDWGVWPTIDKLDPGKSLLSILEWHFKRFGSGTTLEDFSLHSRWCSVRLVPVSKGPCRPRDNGLSMKKNWQRITNCKWEDCNSQSIDVDFKPPVVDDSFSNTVKKLGELHWNVEDLKGDFDTQLICASGPGIKWEYYYTVDRDRGKEFWVWKDPQGKLIYRYARDYTEGPLPEGVKNTKAGVTDKEAALQVPPNSPPVANAGPDQMILVGSTVQLNAGGSYDPDDCTIKYTWKLISKPRGSGAGLSRINIANPTFKADKAGDYILELKVDDGRGGTAADQVKITASAALLFVSSMTQGTITRIDLGTLQAQVIATDLQEPEDGVCGPDGFLYFAESIPGNLIRMGIDGSGFVRWKPQGSESIYPEGLSFDSKGDLFFNTRGDSGAIHTGVYRIKKGDPINPPEKVVPAFSQFGEGTAFLKTRPFAGDLLAVDHSGNRIVRSHPPAFGSSVDFITGVSNPVGIAINSAGEVVVSEGHTGNIKKFASDGSFIGSMAFGFSQPLYLEFDNHDNLYVADFGSGAIVKITPTRNQQTIANIPGAVGIAICRSSVKGLGTDSGIERRNVDVSSREGADGISFVIDLPNAVKDAQVLILDLAGRLLYDSGFVAGSSLRWSGLRSDGRRLANGVYLYVVTVRTWDGRIVRSEVRKLVLLR